MGCLHKVFATEIDVELFAQAERTPAGFGTVKLAGAPLRRCAFTVEQAYDGRGLADVPVREPALLRLAGRGAGRRSARSTSAIAAARRERSLQRARPRQDPRIRCRRPGRDPGLEQPMDPIRRGNYDSGQDYVLEYGELRFTFNERDFSERVEQAARKLGFVGGRARGRPSSRTS